MKNTGAGLQIGTTADQKIGFFAADPVVQPTAAAQAAVGTTGAAAVALTQATKAAATQAALTLYTETHIITNVFPADVTNVYTVVSVTNATINTVWGFATTTPQVLATSTVNTVYGYTAALAAAALPLVSQAKVYLSRVVEAPLPDTTPSAKMPIAPTAGGVRPPANPKAFAENAPLVMTAGMSGSLKLGLRGVDAIRRASCLYHGIRVNIHAARIAGRWSRATLPFWSDR
jgi:hypothetical protein